MFIAIAANSPGAPAGRDVLRDPEKPEGLSLRDKNPNTISGQRAGRPSSLRSAAAFIGLRAGTLAVRKGRILWWWSANSVTSPGRKEGAGWPSKASGRFEVLPYCLGRLSGRARSSPAGPPLPSDSRTSLPFRSSLHLRLSTRFQSLFGLTDGLFLAVGVATAVVTPLRSRLGFPCYHHYYGLC
jgi:hypothetical protein